MKFYGWYKLSECINFRYWIFWYEKCNTDVTFIRILGFNWRTKYESEKSKRIKKKST